ncbi:MAG: CsgG/HfaB family protein [Phycisphaeraceae bacterium]
MLLVLALGLPAAAQEGEPEPAAADRPLTVAVLDFDVDDVADAGLGEIIGQTVTIMLAGEPGFETLDRAAIDRLLAEQELTLTGLVDTAAAVEVGQLVGARLLIVGRAFQLGERTFITAKLIGTETSRVDGVLVQGEPGAPLDELVLALAQRLAERLPEAGPRLVADGRPVDPLPALREALAGRELPRVAVVITEEHVGQPRDRPAAPDPAAETEVKRLLRAAGVTVQDVEGNVLTQWAEAARRGRRQPWPRELAGVDLVVAGEAFSEFAAQIGNLHSVAARVEINVISRSRGEIVVADRATTRAVDLAEQIAGKSALEKAGRSVAVELLRYIDEHAPAAGDGEDAE